MKNKILPPTLFKQADFLIFVLLAIIAVVYIPVFNNLLTNWDDEIYITDNPFLKSLSFENLNHIFTVYYAGNYHPLTLVSLAIDFKLGGMQPWPYQLTNMVLHLCNILLVYYFIKLLTQKLSPSLPYSYIALITAALFGIHTFQVESVAWISERKNVLYSFFFLASLILYLKYTDNKSYRTYILTLFIFLLSLLSKGMAVPLSICVIIIDYLSGRKLLSKNVLLEKIPFVLLSLLFGLIALRAQESSDAIRITQQFSLLDRMVIASYGFLTYLIKLCFPYQLSAFYPYPVKTGTFLPLHFYLYAGLLILFLFISWRFFRKNKIVVFGFLFFIANISIVIQILPVGDSIMADRYVYIPSVGFFFIVGYLCAILWQKNYMLRNSIYLFLLIYCSVLGIKTFQRVGIWKNSFTLWNDSMKKYPENNDRAFLSLGIISYEKGNYNEALKYHEHVLQMKLSNNKAYGQAYINIGLVKMATNDSSGAMSDFDKSLTYSQSYEAYFNKALLKIRSGDIDGALIDLDKATLIDPFGKGAYINRGTIFIQKGRYTEALQNFDKILQFDPQNSYAYLGKGQVKEAMNDIQGALVDYNTALSYEETYEGYIKRSAIKIELQDFKGALTDLDNAIRLNSSGPEAYLNKGVAYYQTGDYPNSLIQYNYTIHLEPNNSKALIGRGQTKQAMNDIHGAMDDYNMALSFNPSYYGYLNRAGLKYFMKDLNGALMDLEKASEMDSSGYEAFFNKGFINLQNGKFKIALKEFNKAIELNPNDFEAYLNRGTAKYKLMDYEGTIDDMNRSIQISQTKSALYFRGMAYIKTVQTQKGCSDLEQSANLGNTDAQAEFEKNCK